MIRFENVSLSFGKKVIFDRLDLTVADKGITAVTGPSGKGKTTLLKIINGIVKPDSGTVDITYKKVATVFQDQRLLPWFTALDNVCAVNIHRDRADAVKLLNAFGISDDDCNRFPIELSGGMCQRVCIARALFYDGDLLLLDEPFNGLDEDNRKVAVEVIKSVSKKIPVILVSHITEDVMIADQIVDLSKI